MCTLFFAILLFLLHYICNIESLPKRQAPDGLKRFDIQIQGYTPIQGDDYVAVSIKAEPGYIVEYEPFAHADRVHHMLLYGCTSPAYTDRNFWQGMATCGGSSHILYAWARNAPPLKLPKDVAFAIGNGGDPVQYIVLQIHYAKKFNGNVRDFSGLTMHLSPIKPKFLAGVYLMLSGESILPGHSAFYTNMSCTYDADTRLYPFAFRTHTHQMGRAVSAYVKKADTGKWLQIGKRNPQWPQLFQLRENPGDLVIGKGDSVAGTCRYDSSDKHEIVPMGSMGKNEMCNFYMMFYWEATDPDPFPYGGGCFGDQSPDLLREYPNDGLTLLPTHADLELKAHQGGKPFGVIERQRITKLGGEKLGQVAGLALEPNTGELWILHRAGRVWEASTFDANNRLNERKPIGRPVLLVAHNENKKLKLLAKYGRNQFFLPHGVFVAPSGLNAAFRVIFTTDVGSHQVIKWHIVGDELQAVWTLGEQFVPGSDRKHFCKPAGVTQHSIDGTVFVADGYCNNRVIKFSRDGKFLAEFGHGVTRYGMHPPLGEFSLPHDISLDERGGQVFVADRENGRVQAFTLQGSPLYEVRRPELFPSVYSAHYQQNVGLVFVPGSPVFSQSGQPGEIDVYVVPQATSPMIIHPQVQFSFRGQSDIFRLPHVLRCWGTQVWVGEIANGEGVLWELEVQSESSSSSASASKYHLPLFPIGGPSTSLLGGRRANFSIFGSSILVLLLTTCCVCCAFGLLAWRCCCSVGAEQDALNRKGFKPLRTFELLDDDEEEELDELSDDSEVEMERQQRKNTKEKRRDIDGGGEEKNEPKRASSTTTANTVITNSNDGTREKEKESGL